MKLIDADTFKHRMYHEVFEKDSEAQRWDSGCWMRYRLFDKILEEQPAVDAVEVIRCKDCKHWNMVDLHFHKNICSKVMRPCDESNFCSWAERRQE